jgi:hypothetical protein
VLRFEVQIDSATPLPPIDLDADVIEIGSAADAALRLPAGGVRPHHVRIERGASPRLVALDPCALGDRALARGDVVDLILPARLVLAGVTIAITAASGTASAPVRTASLAREVIRAMVSSASGAPSLYVEAGPATGARCVLPPPPSRLVIGRGEDADWIVLDPDLSRAHLAIERTWDAITVHDLGSKNGSTLDSTAIPPSGLPLPHDGLLAAGSTRIRFTDPAARYLAELSKPPTPSAAAVPVPAAVPAPAPAPAAVTAATRPSTFWIFAAIAALATAAMIWVLL